jgi:hypothetical protein
MVEQKKEIVEDELSEEENVEIVDAKMEKSSSVVTLNSLPAMFDLIMVSGSTAKTLTKLIWESSW